MVRWSGGQVVRWSGGQVVMKQSQQNTVLNYLKRFEDLSYNDFLINSLKTIFFNFLPI